MKPFGIVGALSSLLFLSAPAATAQDKLIIGQSIELSGQAIGAENVEGAKAYFSWLNSQGGIHGRQIELRTYDDGRSKQKTIENTKKLLEEDKAIALFGYRSTPTVEAVLPLLLKEKVALIAPFSGAQSLHKPFNPYIFHLRASYQNEAAKIVESLATLQITKVAILHQDDAFGHDALFGFEQSLAQRQLKPVLITKYDRKKLDVTHSVEAVAAANPEAVVMACTPSACVDFIRQVRQRGLRPQFIMLSNVNSDDFFKSLGEDGRGIGVTQVMPFPRDLSATVVREFQRVLRAMKEPPPASYATLEGFVAAKLLAEGLRRAGPSPTRQKLTDALASMRTIDLGGVELGYGPDDRSGSRFVELTIIGRNGVFWR